MNKRLFPLTLGLLVLLPSLLVAWLSYRQAEQTTFTALQILVRQASLRVSEGSDLNLTQLRMSLGKLMLSENSLAFVVDQKGLLLATSQAMPSNTVVGSSLDAQSALIRASARNLPQRFIATRHPQIEKPLQGLAASLELKSGSRGYCSSTPDCQFYVFDLDGGLVLAQASLLTPNLANSAKSSVGESYQYREDPHNWSLVIAVPLIDFTTNHQARFQQNALVAFVLALLVSLCSFFLVRGNSETSEEKPEFVRPPAAENQNKLSTIPIKPQASAKVASSLGELYPLRMLVVDDNTLNHQVASMLLGRYGYQVSSAHDGQQALDQILAAELRQQAFDIIWMDLHMPNLDGIQSTKILRSLNIAQPRIIAMTASAMDGDREICMLAGMNDYVTKPLDGEQLQRALRGYFQARGIVLSKFLSALVSSPMSEFESGLVQPKMQPKMQPKIQSKIQPMVDASPTIDTNLSELSKSGSSPKFYFDPDRFSPFDEEGLVYRNAFLGLIRNMVAAAMPQFEEGRLAWQEGRGQEAAQVIHRMRGALGTLGSDAFVEAAQQLEAAILETVNHATPTKQVDQQALVEALFKKTKFVLQAAIEQAQQWLDTKSS
ncbi:MAG: response regulator [Undibacterium sp.]|nr:response regulator [Undibacterium sp.]